MPNQTAEPPQDFPPAGILNNTTEKPYLQVPDIQKILTAEDWAQLSALYKIDRFEKPKTILNKGQTNKNLYFILEGNVQIIIDPNSSAIHRLERGEFFGEMSFLDRLPTTASVIAESGSRIACIDGDGLQKVCRLDSAFAERLYKYLALLLTRRLRKNIAMVRDTKIILPAKKNRVEPRDFSINRYTFRPLLLKEEIRSALKLLHEIYVIEQQWIPQEFNPSRVRIEYDTDGNGLLVDKFSEVADWFGAFHDEHLVGCFRVLPYPALELKEYRDLPLFMNHSNISELNRLAIRPQFRHQRFTLLVLLRIAFDHAISLNDVVYVTAQKPEPAQLFEKLGLKRVNSPSFKYNLTETGEVDLLYFDCRTRHPNETALYRISNKLMDRVKREA